MTTPRRPSAIECPFCCAHFSTTRNLRKHLILYCWKHAESKHWLTNVTRSYTSAQADAIAAGHQAECIKRIRALRLANNQAGEASHPSDQAQWVQERGETEHVCPFCNEASNSFMGARNHLVKMHADQYKTKRFRKALHSLYEPRQADARLRTMLRKIAAAASWASKEARQRAEKSSSSDSEEAEETAVASKSKDKIKGKLSNPQMTIEAQSRPAKAVYVASSAWEPLREHVSSPPPEPIPTIHQQQSYFAQFPQTEETDTPNKSFMDCVLSKTILIWYVWLIASRLPFQVQVTAELVMLRPFDGVVSAVQEALERTHADGQIGLDDLQEMTDCWGGDEQFDAAYEAMKAAGETCDGKASHPDNEGGQDLPRRYMRQQLGMWSTLLLGWIQRIQDTWIKLGNRIVQHAAEQTWRSIQDDREYRWHADGTSLFQQSEGSQLTIVKCLTAHYSHWRPLFVELSHFVNTSEEKLDAIFDTLADSYANDIAPLSIERMTKIDEEEL
ncbi:hypothetical protein BCR37DRAFT_377712 [Protomyces lactucae-debilis]|uniref:C2H2-type domain-containing protein n=1 Tax=Protomyces lactucae-debilis TaxID=2754530 RepID=A0A1Y2FNH4_PROLT|nr:uncharacterized protein BCR37DRAFT_377712 [Protomyces lactucae-debilis]ORY84884.1 hypothetical protein BCR37DRAFT_377712 [Protomyces lactucae-debilis]